MNGEHGQSEQPGAGQATEEALLRISEGQKDAILNGITANVAFVDKDLRLLWVNVTAAKSVNKSPAEMIGRTCHAFWADPAKPCQNCPTLKAFQTKQTEHTFMYTPDGRVWDERGEPVFDENGNVIGVVEIAQDITERMRAEEALRYNSAIIEETIDAIITTKNDESFTITNWNTGAEKIYGWKKEEVLGRSSMFLQNEYPGQDPREVLEKILETGLYEGEVIQSRKDGTRVFIDTRLIARKDNKGETTDWICINRDITERKRVEEALLESEALQRILLDNLPAGVVIVDPLTRVIERVNDHVASLFGAPVDHLVGQRCHSLLCPASEGACPVLDLGQDVDNSDRVMLRMDGSRLPILKTVKRIQLNGQEKLLECFVDVSERKLAEEVLRESEEKYHLLIETMQDGVYRSSHEGRFLEVNPAMVKLLGYDSKEELLAIDIKSQLYFAPEDRESAGMKEQLEEMRAFRLRKKDGSEIWVEDHGRYVVDDEGVVLYHEGVLRDITERKQLEERIRQVRSDLLFAVSHDLKSPLQALNQSQELLSALQPGEGLARFQEYREIWRRNLKRLERMINNLMDSQRAEEGRFPLLLAPCDAVQLVKSAVEDSQGYALSSQVTIDLTLQPVPEGVCDEEALARVVENLLTNAVKFSPKGGQVKVSLSLEDSTFLLEVEDHGLGIPAQEQAQLFQPFQRGRSAEQKRITGTGLGLYVSRRIVEEHGGAISLTSEEGKGTKVTVRLPWGKGQA